MARELAMANVPTEVRLHRKSRLLSLVYSDGTRYELSCELLRVQSPSAEVRGHGESERILQVGKKYVNITEVEAVGNYALRFTFDDGHDSGIYSWDYLGDLGHNQSRYWQAYLEEIEKAGASRLPTIPIGQWRPPERSPSND
ncbi:MAG: DUF971 domain-containing protein [Pseudomonadales bacterium]